MSQAAPHAGAGATPADDGREHLARVEVTGVLGHYDTGAVRSVREFIAGSSTAPKAVIECERGKLLLKRRGPGLEHATIVGFAHEVILGCLERGVCVPPLIGTARDNNSMCQVVDRTYELFAFIDGTPYARTPEQARSSGALLAEMHGAMDGIRTSFAPVREASVVDVERAARVSIGEGTRGETERILGYAHEAHALNGRDPALVHGDWHPGNMIYGGGEIIAACDFDNTRVGSRDRELAQALVYFSLRRGGDPEGHAPDPDLLGAFWGGYAGGTGIAPSARLAAAMMPAVVLDEAMAAVASGLSDPALARLAYDKALWLDAHARDIESSLGGG